MSGERWRSMLAAAAAGASLSGIAAASPVELAPHRAVYDLVLDETAGGGEMAGVSGRLVMEFTGSECAGYTSKLRFVTAMEDLNGDRQITDSRSSIYESGDGQRLEFSNQTYTDQMLAEESRGTARRAGRDVAVRLARPAPKRFEISQATVFPTEQMERIIAAAIAGETFLYLDVYDGSEDGETVFATAGLIGRVSTDVDDYGGETAVADAGVAGMRHWPVTLSYFDKAAIGDTAPFYVLSLTIYENGIGRSLQIDYGDFGLDGRLTGLELLPSAPCPD